MGIPHASKLPLEYEEGIYVYDPFEELDLYYGEYRDKGYLNGRLGLFALLVGIEEFKYNYKEGLFEISEDDYHFILRKKIEQYNNLACEILK